MIPPKIESNLASASTLPSAWYLDPKGLELEREAVFAANWQLLLHTGSLAASGDFATTDVAGEPILVVRDGNEIRAMSNVCRHRAGPVASGCGNRKAFRCGYHGWAYSLAGGLLAAPDFDGVDDFRPEEVSLPRFRAANWGPFLFANLGGRAPDLSRYMPEVFARTANLRFDGFRSVERRDYVLACNWKVYVDNYLEGYHIPIVHPGLMRELDYDAYRTETFEHCSLQIAPIRGGSGPERRYRRPEGSVEDAAYFWVYPNLMINIYLDSISTNVIVPISAERTLTIFEWYFRDSERPEAREAIDRTIRFSDEIQQEDIAICEAVQRGLNSRSYDRGRYSARRENGVHHFHGLLARDLGSRDPG